MAVKYVVTLTGAELDQLKDVTSSGKHNAQFVKRGLCLLKCNEGEMTDTQIASSLSMHTRTVEEIRRRFVQNGFEACLNGLPGYRKQSIMHGENQARLIALACEAAPDGVHHFSLRLLSEKFVTVEGIHVSHETVRKTLNSSEIKPWQSKEYVIPPEENADFVADMENVLDLYMMPRDPDRPVVCMDESPRQLISEVRTPIPMGPGSPLRYDTEYRREGTANTFIFFAPLENWRRAEVTERRTALDWAHQVKKLVDDDFPEAKRITLVCDNLNTHRVSSLYKAFPAVEARRLTRRLEIVYTPKHGSWLNMAEIELSVMNRTGLSDRIPTIEQFRREVAAWAKRRNSSCKGVIWQFTTEDARVKLARLYPQFTT